MSKFATATALTLCCLTVLPACQSANTAQKSVNSYLKALGSDEQSSRQYLCWYRQEAKELSPELPVEIKKWEITGEKQQVDQKDPDSRHTIVSVRIESKSVGGFFVTRTWDFEVWKSDEFYESVKRAYDHVNQVFDNKNKVFEDTSKLLGDPTLAKKSPLIPPPKRNTINSKPYCITVIKKSS